MEGKFKIKGAYWNYAAERHLKADSESNLCNKKINQSHLIKKLLKQWDSISKTSAVEHPQPSVKANNLSPTSDSSWIQRLTQIMDYYYSSKRICNCLPCSRMLVCNRRKMQDWWPKISRHSPEVDLSEHPSSMYRQEDLQCIPNLQSQGLQWQAQAKLCLCRLHQQSTRARQCESVRIRTPQERRQLRNL